VPLVADVGSEAGVERLIATVDAQVGSIDLFMSNAGVAAGHGLGDDDAWDLSWRVNTMAHVWAARHLLPGMLTRGSGYLVSTASAAGMLIEPGSAPYTLTKHAAVALAEWIAVNHGDVVGVSVVCPQGVDTPMLASLTDTSAALTLADGVLGVDDVAAAVVAGVTAGEFLITPHPVVRRYEVG